MIARLALILGLLVYLGLTFGSASSAPPPPAVSVVYFHPNDQAPTVDYPADAIVQDVQSWYGEQVGLTFPLSPAEVVEGQGDPAYYQQDIWGTVLRELGYWCGTGVHVIVVHPSIGLTGGGACSDGEGTAMIEEDIFAGEELRPFNGVVAHELGHAFGLPHTEECSIMSVCWIFYPDVGLTAGEVAVLREHRYFGAVDTDPECEIRFNPRGKRIGKCKEAR